jgi:serine/threonine-protein kinase
VPPILGHGGGTAAAEVRAAGLLPRVHTVDRFSARGEGAVAAQDPPAGAIVSPDTTVDIFVASGSVEVPRVDGLSEQAAWDLLQVSGFKIDTRRAPSSGVARGQAVAVSPSSGLVVPAGTSVVLVISQGE